MGLVTGILVARWLGPYGRGQLATVISWTSLIAYLGNLGLPVALTYASAREPRVRHQLMGNAAVAALIQWLILGTVGWVLLPVLLSRHGEALTHLAVMYLWVYLPLNLLTLYANAIQQGSGYYARFNIVRISVPVTYASLLIVFWAVGSMNVSTVVLVNLLSNAVALAFALCLAIPPLWRSAKASITDHWVRVSGLRANLKYGLSAQIGTLQPFSGMQLDVLALTLLSASGQIGLYMAALAGANLIRAQGYALGQVVLPEVAKRTDQSEQWRIIRRFMLLALVGGGGASIIVQCAASPLIRLVYGHEFTPAAPILRILVVAGTIGAVYRILGDGVRGMGKPSIMTMAELIGALGGFAALLVLIPHFGAIGAGWAVLVSSVLSLVSAAFLARKFASADK